MSILVFLFTTGLAGCMQDEPELPPVFNVDEIRYWWEGNESEFLMVNVTIRNTQNFTTGWDAPNPWMRLYLTEFEDTGRRNSEGMRVYSPSPRSEFTLYFNEVAAPNSRTGGRWYDDKAEAALGLPPQGSHFGPVMIAPNETKSPEIVFKPDQQFTGLSGYYMMQVHIVAAYPGTGGTVWTDYYTGCFNEDLPEFYGYDKAKDGKCVAWDCIGGPGPEIRYSIYREHGKPRQVPDCSATGAVGPYYDG